MSINDNIGSFLDNGASNKIAFRGGSVSFCGVGSREPESIAIQVTSMAMAICQPAAAAAIQQKAPTGRGL